MEEIKYNSRAYARLGQSGAIFGMAAVALHDKYNIKCLSADMSTPAGLDRFKRTYPEDFHNVGIAEQNLIGTAAGLASEGYTPVCVTQAAFISMRSFEQVRQFMGYMEYPIIVIGLSSGFALSFLGNTHYCIEDIALMRSIPGLTVFSPADAGEAVKVFEVAVKMRKPVYIRLTAGLMTPIVYKDDYIYDEKHATKVCEYGSDVTIFATGSMVFQAQKAAELLNNQGLGCRVWDIHCIKPIDVTAVVASLESKMLVTIEEHNVIGGIGTAISEILAERENHPRLLKLGVKDCFSPVGEYQYLLDYHRLTADQIAEDIKNKLKC